MEEGMEQRLARKRAFAEFLEWRDEDDWSLADQIKEDLPSKQKGGVVLKTQCNRINVPISRVHHWNSEVWQNVLDRPAEYLPGFQDAIKDFGRTNPELSAMFTEDTEVAVGLKGDFGERDVSPRGLNSSHLGKLVKVFGIVTKCSLVRPKLVKSVHYVPATDAYVTTHYRDVTALTGLPTGAAYPTRTSDGDPMVTEFGRCRYKDNQMVTLQELPETALPGQLPHSAEVFLEDDLVDLVKPGDRVAITGIFRPLVGAASGTYSGICRSVVVGIAVEKLTQDKITWLDKDIEHITALAGRPWALELLARALAPSIYGHDEIKRGLVLMLMGGMERQVNSSHIRGDINCLLVGDPGVAKSQLLRAVMNLAPHAVSTTGKGSSGVGLTAAVTSDRETGEKRLEAGAMVLADRGVVCIDEFDKMNDDDRVAIHEVMEQQTVTIAKAGIQASLNARCSVLAAANPLYGTYDRQLSIPKNVALPDSLLSRFDLCFVVIDNTTPAVDAQIAGHVLKQHCYRDSNDTDAAARELDIRELQDNCDFKTRQAASVWLKGEAARAAARGGGGGGLAAAEEVLGELAGVDPTEELPDLEGLYEEDEAAMDEEEEEEGGAPRTRRTLKPLSELAAAQRTLELSRVLDPEFVKRYILYVRRFRYKGLNHDLPMSQEAKDLLLQEWVDLRQHAKNAALPVTARCLESLIRLAQAHAKLHLGHMVELVDAQAATALLRYCFRQDDALFSRYAEEADAEARAAGDDKNRRKKGGGRGGRDQGGEGEDEEDEGMEDDTGAGAGDQDPGSSGQQQQHKRRRDGGAAEEPTPKRARDLTTEEKQAIGRALQALGDISGPAGVSVAELLATVAAEHSGVSEEQLVRLLEQHSAAELAELPPLFYDPSSKVAMLVA